MSGLAQSATELRDEGLAAVNATTPAQWAHDCDNAIAAMAASGAEFTAEDVRSFAGEPPKPAAMGARFLAAAKRGIIRRVGVTHGKRPSSHARLLLVYQGTAR